VTGVLSVINELANDRSLRANHRLTKITRAGNTAASTTPSRNRTVMSAGMFDTTPVSDDKPPHRSRHQNTIRFALRRSA
jgi:hypothetical protein